MGELAFVTTLKELAVTIDGKPYLLKELDGKGQSQWRNSLGGDYGIDEDEKAFIKNINLEDPELCLLSLCLYDTEGHLVPRSVMEKWPSTILRKLYDAAQELSGLNIKGRKRQEDQAKKS